MIPDFGSSEAASQAGKLGGRARAEALSPEQRSAIARAAVEARWKKAGKLKEVPQATHGSPDRPLKIGDLEIPCYVLADGRRVLAQAGMMKALAMTKSGTAIPGEEGVGRLAKFVAGKSVSPFISSDLRGVLSNPINFRLQNGGPAYGFEATVLPELCDSVLEARKQGVLMHHQENIAKACEIIVRGLATVGIIALVDEATGYQDVRARDALAKILEAFVAKELRKWVKTFPPEYFKEMCRLRGKPFSADMKLPRYFGVHTNDVVYSRLAPGVLAELRAKNPTTETGRRKHKNFQWLTEDVGNPKLLQHLAAVVALMRASLDWDGFKALIDRALPKYQSLPLLDGNEFDS